jgi:hypothetical protein
MVAIFLFLNLSSVGGAYYYNRLTDVFKEVILLDRSQTRSLRQNACPHPDEYTEIINNNDGNHRSLHEQTSPYFDPKTITSADMAFYLQMLGIFH